MAAIDPKGLTLQEWADSTILALRSSWNFGRLDREDQWQDWAANMVRALPVARRVLPNPYQFTDWREWAMRVYPMLEGSEA